MAPTLPRFIATTFRGALCCVLVVCGAFATPTARASELSSAELHLRLLLPEGAPAAAASVKLEPDGWLGATWTMRTRENGTADIALLPPGRYRINVVWTGRVTQPATIWIRPGEFTSAIVAVELAGADSLVLRMKSMRRADTSVTVTLDEPLLQDLPHGDNAASAVETIVPSALSARLDTGGVATGSTPIVGNAAASWTQTTYHVWGADVTDTTLGGTALVYPIVDAFEGLAVASALLPVEMDAPGPTVGLIPRRATSSWHGSANFASTPASWTSGSATVPPRIETLSSWTGGGISVTGPLGSRAGLALSGTLIRSDQRDRYGVEFPGDVSSLVTAVTICPGDARQLEAFGVLQETSHAWTGRALFERSAAERDRFTLIRAGWRQMLGPRAMLRFEGGYERRTSALDKNGDQADATLERLRDGFVPTLAMWGLGSNARWSASATVARSFGASHRARHSFRAGVGLTSTSATRGPLGLPPIAETVGGLPARVWLYDYTGRSHWRDRTLSAFVADRFAPGTRLFVEAALGMHRTTGSAEDGVGADISWTSWSPRGSLRLTSEGGATALLGGYARYHARSQLSFLAFGDASGPTGGTYRWHDGNADGVFDASEQGVQISRVGPGSGEGWSRIDPRLERPAIDEYVVGVERTWAGSIRSRLVGIARRERQLVQAVNVGVPPSRYAVTFLSDRGLDAGDPSDDQQLPIYDRSPASFGEDAYLLTNPGASAHAEGIELTVWREVVGRLRLLVGVSAWRSNGPAASRGFRVEENDPGTLGEIATDPNAATHATSRSFFDRAYVIKASGSYRAPHGLTVGVASRYQDGQPFARMVVVPDLNQGAEAIRAYENGRTRFTYTLTVDARVRLAFQTGRARLAGVLDVFNLLNTSHEVEELSFGDAFRTPSARQPARAVRLGIHAEF